MATMQPENEIPSAPADDTDQLLAEFAPASAQPGAGNPTPGKPAAEPPAAPQQSYAERLLAKAAEREAAIAAARQPKQPDPAQAQQNDRLSELEQFASQIQAERIAERDRKEADEVFSKAQEIAAEVTPWLPPEMARAWLLNEVSTDGELATAWENRHNSEQDAYNAHRAVRRALNKMQKHLKSLPDPAATEDRSIVTAAVRGASGAPPAPRAPNFNNMSDAQFAQHIEQTHGFRPLR